MRGLRALALVVACAAFAFAPASALAKVTWSSFSLTPTSLQAGGATNYTITNKFTNSSDSVKDLTTVQAPGLYAAPANVGSVCTPTQLTGGTCPSAAQIGTASISAVALGIITQTLSGKLYNMAAQSSAEVARIGMYAAASGLASATSTQTSVQLRSSPTVGLNLITSSIPDKNGSLSITISSITETVDGTVNSKSFVRMPTSCAAASSTGILDSYSVSTPVTSSASSFTPTGCTSGSSALKYSPSLTAATVTPDSGDTNVAAAVTVKQNATDAASSALTVKLPGALAPNLATLNQANANGCTSSALSKCLVVGTVTGTTSLLSATATGSVYLVGNGSGKLPSLSIAMNAPFSALQFNASLSIAASNTLVASFTGLPDMPLTSLVISLTGGANSLLQEGATIGCSSSVTGAFTAADGATATSTTPITVSGTVPACPAAQSYPNGSSGSATTSSFGNKFQLSPSSTAAGTLAGPSDPNVTANLAFTYANSTDSVKDAVVHLGSGILATPSAVSADCSPSQLTSNSCPAGSQIGTGTVVANATGTGVAGAQTLPARAYLMAAQSASEFARIGLVVSLGTTALFTEQAPVTLDSGGHMTLSFSSIPDSVTLFPSAPVTVATQITSLSLTFNGTVDGNPFIFAPSQCTSASSSSVTDSYAGSDSTTTPSAYTPTACDTSATLPATGTGTRSDGTSVSFNLTPSTTAINGNPNLASTMAFDYQDSSSALGLTEANCADEMESDPGFTCDYLQNLDVQLAPGLIANPETVGSSCTASQLESYSCPAAAQIGSGTVTVDDYDTTDDGLYGTNTLTVKAFIMPSTSASELAEVGLDFYLSGSPIGATTVIGSATLDEGGHVNLVFDNLPQESAIGSGGAEQYIQVTGLTLTFNGSVTSEPFTVNPSGCTQSVSTVTAQNADDTSVSAQSSFTPTGC